MMGATQGVKEKNDEQFRQEQECFKARFFGRSERSDGPTPLSAAKAPAHTTNQGG